MSSLVTLRPANELIHTVSQLVPSQRQGKNRCDCVGLSLGLPEELAEISVGTEATLHCSICLFAVKVSI